MPRLVAALPLLVGTSGASAAFEPTGALAMVRGDPERYGAHVLVVLAVGTFAGALLGVALRLRTKGVPLPWPAMLLLTPLPWAAGMATWYAESAAGVGTPVTRDLGAILSALLTTALAAAALFDARSRGSTRRTLDTWIAGLIGLCAATLWLLPPDRLLFVPLSVTALALPFGGNREDADALAQSSAACAPWMLAAAGSFAASAMGSIALITPALYVLALGLLPIARHGRSLEPVLLGLVAGAWLALDVYASAAIGD